MYNHSRRRSKIGEGEPYVAEPDPTFRECSAIQRTDPSAHQNPKNNLGETLNGKITETQIRNSASALAALTGGRLGLRAVRLWWSRERLRRRRGDLGGVRGPWHGYVNRHCHRRLRDQAGGVLVHVRGARRGPVHGRHERLVLLMRDSPAEVAMACAGGAGRRALGVGHAEQRRLCMAWK
jgi:hypothetical protein